MVESDPTQNLPFNPYRFFTIWRAYGDAVSFIWTVSCTASTGIGDHPFTTFNQLDVSDADLGLNHNRKRHCAEGPSGTQNMLLHEVHRFNWALALMR